MGKFSIDASWVAELVRQGVYLVVAMKWWNGDLTQQTLVISFLSLLLTGIVNMFTASSRVLERAGTSVEQVKSVAAHPDAQMVAVVEGRMLRRDGTQP